MTPHFHELSLRTTSEEVKDPCLPSNMEETVTLEDKTLTLRGTGDFVSCRTALRPVLQGNATAECNDRTCKVTHSFAKPPVRFTNLEFFGTSEFFYTMRDTLRIAGHYSATDFSRRAQVQSCRNLTFLLHFHLTLSLSLV